MTTVKNSYGYLLAILPMIIGAYFSGALYLAPNLPIPVTLFQLGLVFGFVFFVYSKLAARDIDIQFYGLEKEYVLFLCIIFISLVYSPEREQGLFYSIRFLVLILMTYLIYNCINKQKELSTVLMLIVGISSIIAAYNVYQFYLNPQIAAFNFINQGTKLIRSSGFETDPNIFASYLFIPLMCVVCLFERAGNRMKIFWFSIAGILLLSVLLTYSRSSWVAIFFGLLFISYHKKSLRFPLYCLGAFLVVFIVSEEIRTTFFSVIDRVGEIFAGKSDDSSRFRIILFQTSILMWLDSYTFGIGYQGFSTVFKDYHPPQEVGWVYEPHNEFYTVLSELGTIGFIIFIFIIIKIINLSYLSLKEYAKQEQDDTLILALFSSFICYLIFFQFLGGMQYHTAYMINLGLLFSSIKLIKTQKQSWDNSLPS